MWLCKHFRYQRVGTATEIRAWPSILLTPCSTQNYIDYTMRYFTVLLRLVWPGVGRGTGWLKFGRRPPWGWTTSSDFGQRKGLVTYTSTINQIPRIRLHLFVFLLYLSTILCFRFFLAILLLLRSTLGTRTLQDTTASMSSGSTQSRSADSIMECPDGDENILHQHPFSTISQSIHRLAFRPDLLKSKSAASIVSWDASIDRGLVKNARVLVTDVGTPLITIRVLRPDQEVVDGIPVDEDILHPRITSTSNLRSRHALVRRQFPLAPAYACTSDGCQGLTCDRIGADLTRPVFSHG